jgi:hypothetical protein
MGRADFDATLVPLIKPAASSCLWLGEAPSDALTICCRSNICSASRHEVRAFDQGSNVWKTRTP